MTYGVVYTITNKLNGKQYVGQTTQPVEKRWASHIRETTHRIKQECATPLRQAIKKYTPSAFEVEAIIACDSKEELDQMEAMAIAVGGTLRPGGYNLMTGGSKGRPSNETRAKLSAAMRGKPKPYMIERNRSPDIRSRVSAALKGRAFTPEHAAALRAARQGRTLSEAHKRNLSIAFTGRNHPRAIPVVRGDGMRFDTETEAARSVGGCQGGVSACCRGERKTHKGFTWRYADVPEEQC